MVEGVGDGQAERHQQSLLNAPRRRAEVDVAIDHAGHDGEMLGVDDVGVARDVTAAIDAHDRVALQDEHRPTRRLGARTVDQRATPNSSCHAPYPPGNQSSTRSV